MSFLYFLVTGCKAYADKLEAYKYYFETEGGFTAAFLLALAVAGIFAIIYYLFCRASFSWAKIGTWVITMLVAACVAFGLTGWATGMHKEQTADTGIRHAVELQAQEAAEAQTMDYDEIEDARVTIHDGLDKGMFTSPVIFRLCVTNFVLTIILFYVISLLINGFSVHGVNIPHPGVYRP